MQNTAQRTQPGPGGCNLPYRFKTLCSPTCSGLHNFELAILTRLFIILFRCFQLAIHHTFIYTVLGVEGANKKGCLQAPFSSSSSGHPELSKTPVIRSYTTHIASRHSTLQQPRQIFDLYTMPAVGPSLSPHLTKRKRSINPQR